MATHPADNEVQRAKAQLKASLLLGLDGTTATAEDLGRQLVTTGRRATPKEIEAAIESVSVGDIQRVAKKCTSPFLAVFGEVRYADFCSIRMFFLFRLSLLPNTPSPLSIYLTPPLSSPSIIFHLLPPPRFHRPSLSSLFPLDYSQTSGTVISRSRLLEGPRYVTNLSLLTWQKQRN